MSNPQNYLETLVSQESEGGGWGYFQGQSAQLEPTCLALLALNLDPERYRHALDRGLTLLERSARPDGAYDVGGRVQAIWPCPLVLFVKHALGGVNNETNLLAAHILRLSGSLPDDPRDFALHDFDARIPGWTWAEGNFAWVEPTAWACLALRSVGLGAHQRVRDGVRLLLDRAHDEGGINYGNRRIFGKLLEPVPGTTALMLLAVQGVGFGADDQVALPVTQADPAPPREHPRVVAAVRYLTEQIEGNNLEHLAWIKLALQCYRSQPGVDGALASLDERIRTNHQARAETGWTRPSPLLEALAALALSEKGYEYFRLPPREARPLPAPLQEESPGLGARLTRTGQKVKAYFRGVLVNAAGQMRPVAPRSQVHIAEADDYHDHLVDVLAAQYESFRTAVPLAGKRVVLKPNLVEWHPERVINTNAHVVRAAIELCRREGAAQVTVAEGPGHRRNVEFLLEGCGMAAMLRALKVTFIDLNHDEPIKCLNMGRTTGLDYLYMARTVVEADVLISMPKLKTHHWAGATLSLKNLFGTLPGICYGWPKNELHWRGIDCSIVDIALTRKPDLAIVDGIVGMEGDGPLYGTPKKLGALIMGTDPLAVDATCCRLMQIDPQKIGYMRLAQVKRLGQMGAESIDQVGVSIESVSRSFELPPNLDSLSGRPAVMAL